MHTSGRLGQGEAVLRHPLPLPGLDKERADASVLATTDGEAAGGPESEGGLSDEVLRMLPLGPCCTCSLPLFTILLLHTQVSSPATKKRQSTIHFILEPSRTPSVSDSAGCVHTFPSGNRAAPCIYRRACTSTAKTGGPSFGVPV